MNDKRKEKIRRIYQLITEDFNRIGSVGIFGDRLEGQSEENGIYKLHWVKYLNGKYEWINKIISYKEVKEYENSCVEEPVIFVMIHAK